MKFAISTDNNMVSEHFGRCPEFTIIDIEKNEIINKITFSNPGHEPGLIPEMLNKKNVRCIISGGMGQRAQNLFMQNGIKVLVGAPCDEPESLVQTYFKGTLVTGENLCDH